MAASAEDIRNLRAHFAEEIGKHLPIFRNMQTDLNERASRVSSEVESFLKTPHVAHTVGDMLSQKNTPVIKLQNVRRSIYANAEKVTLFRTQIFNQIYKIHADAKAYYSALWTSWIGDDVTMTYLESNAEKEREVLYLLKDITKIYEEIKTTYTLAKNNIDWLTENLDQLNRIESALRLEHNMKLTLNDIGSSEGSDELPGQEGQGVDLTDLMDNDITVKPTSTKKGSGAVMKEGYDPLVDDETFGSQPTLEEEFSEISEDDLG